LAWVFAVVLVLLSGIAYRVLTSHLKFVIANPVNLPVPLSAFPSQVGDWLGKDLPIPNTTKEYMENHFADDFFSRRYINTATKAWADVYVVYCSSQPGGMLGHQPRVCYPGHGWIHDSTEQSQFTSQAGRQIACLIHRFHKPAPAYDQTVVLNFYILNGQITTDEDSFSGLFGRRPNIAGDPARYVAQVQISSVLEDSIRTAAKDMTDLILDFLPEKSGVVRTAQHIAKTSDAVK
jgi:EpsI family protein